jgi:hypothetical protein
MSHEEIIETSDDGMYRVKIIMDEGAQEPYDDGASPLLRIGWRYGAIDAQHIAVGGRPAGSDHRIEYAAERYGAPSGSDWRTFEKYLRTFYGVVRIETWYSGDYWYVTYDSAEWRDYTGAPAGSASMDEYKAWCNGECYGYTVEKKVLWQRQDNPEETTFTWEIEEACSGFYGDGYAREAAMEAYKSAVSAPAIMTAEQAKAAEIAWSVDPANVPDENSDANKEIF